MRARDIKVGEIYMLKPLPYYEYIPTYSYVKILCVLKPKETAWYKNACGFYRQATNNSNRIIVKCLHSSSKDFCFGFVRDFLPREIIKDA